MMQENEIKKYEMFRLGPDPYFIGYAAILLIPEIICLSSATTPYLENCPSGYLPAWFSPCSLLWRLASPT